MRGGERVGGARTAEGCGEAPRRGPTCRYFHIAATRLETFRQTESPNCHVSANKDSRNQSDDLSRARLRICVDARCPL